MLINFASLLLLLPVALACSPPAKGQNDTEPSPFVMGPDTPTDPETVGYFTNHFALNVNDLERSIEFYKNVFGFRHIFTFHLTPIFSVTYMAHSSGGKNGTGYQTTEEILREKNNGQGRLEMVYMNLTGKADIPGPSKRATTLSHIGIIVPNTTETQTRLERLGVEIYKKVGEPMPTSGPLSNPYSLGDTSNLSAKDFAEFQDAMSQLNSLNIFAADPDGNLLEILPSEEGNPFVG